MSTTPERAVAAAAAATAAGAGPELKKPQNCWSCRLLSGGGLICAGAYVFNAAQKVMRPGAPATIGTVAQITFAICLASWGVVIIADLPQSHGKA